MTPTSTSDHHQGGEEQRHNTRSTIGVGNTGLRLKRKSKGGAVCSILAFRSLSRVLARACETLACACAVLWVRTTVTRSVHEVWISSFHAWENIGRFDVTRNVRSIKKYRATCLPSLPNQPRQSIKSSQNKGATRKLLRVAMCGTISTTLRQQQTAPALPWRALLRTAPALPAVLSTACTLSASASDMRLTSCFTHLYLAQRDVAGC